MIDQPPAPAPPSRAGLTDSPSLTGLTNQLTG